MRVILFLAAALALGGCASRRPAAAGLERALARAVTDRAGRDTLDLLVECRMDERLTSARVFGSGIGIWNDERQFRLDPDQIRSLLRALQSADFPRMEDTYGGAPRPARPPGGEMVTIAICRIELGLGGYDKRAVQLARGEQSPALKALADDLLRICQAPARLGLTAASLRDGLEKVSRGELAAETLRIVVHRKPQRKDDPPGFLLRIAGNRATTRAYEPARGYRDPVVLNMPAPELRALAGELAARDPATWPSNLHAEEYTDLSIRVLNHEKKVQARQFAGLAPSAYGRSQKAFEEVFQILQGLHRQVLDHGRPAAQRERAARLTVETPGPTRVYLTDGAGAPATPPGVLAYHKGEEHHFIVPGRLEIELPPGRYRLSAERGPEHRPVSLDVELRAGERGRAELRPERWTDMNARGWYSADLHNHRKVEEIPTLLRAEDLNLAPTLADWVWEDSQRGQAPVTTDAIRKVDARHAYSVLDKEVERLMEGPGAVDLVGLKSAIPFEGYRLFPPNNFYTEAAHRQGGYVDAEKIVWRDVPVLVALGQIDFAGIVYNHFNRQDVEFETDRWGMIPKWRPEFTTVAGMPLWAMEVYYRFLNCGFRLPASAGSASGVKAAPLGYNRVYVRLDEPFSYAAWFRALKAGRSFATNGPLLFLTVDGREPGAVVNAAGGAKLRVRVEAQSLRPLDRVEVIYRGGVVRTLRPPARLAVEFDFTPDSDGWIAARAFERPGRTIRFSHTSPVYLERGVPASAADDARFFLDWIDREIRLYQASTNFRSEADRAAMLDFFAKGRAVYERLAR